MDTATRSAPLPSIAHRVVNDESISPEEYQSFAREREERFEYIDGWMSRMAAAATWPHSVIASNVDRVLGTRLLDTKGRTASRNINVALPSAGTHVFPDVVVVCGDPAFDAKQGDRPHVEHYVRQDDGSGRFPETDGPDAEIDLPSLDAALPFSEIYRDVSFDSDENE